MLLNEINVIIKTLEPKMITVEEVDARRFKGDLLGLLTFNGISIKYPALIMRINNLSVNTEYTGESGILYHYDDVEVEEVLGSLI